MSLLILEDFFNKKNYEKLSKRVKIVKSIKNYSEIEYIFCRLNKNLTDKYLKDFINLKYIITPTTGLTHISKSFSKKKILNLRTDEIKNIKSTSELNLTLILSASRKLFDYISHSRKKIISRYKYKTLSFNNLTIGIIGVGRVGSYLKKHLNYLGFKTLVYDRKKKGRQNDLKKLMQFSDIISLNISSEVKNYNFFDYKLMSICKKKPILINTSRGELINQRDLFRALKEGKISEAYLDVVKDEQRIIKNKKYPKKMQNLINANKIKISPHIGGSNEDAMIFTENLVINKLLRLI